MAINETQRLKLVLLLLLLISSIFILGCSTHGKKDEEDVRYEFCPGGYFKSASEYDNMLYYAVNQSSVSGSVRDPNDSVINGTGFKGPVNMADDNGGIWVADGFYEDQKEKRFEKGIYTLYFETRHGNYETKRDMNWDKIPQWKGTAEFDTVSANDPSRSIYIKSPGIITSDDTANYEIRYRIKLYVAYLSYSQLFGQSESTTSPYNLSYTLPKVSKSIDLVPVLVCEMYQDYKIQKILYYPGEKFTYNP